MGGWWVLQDQSVENSILFSTSRAIQPHPPPFKHKTEFQFQSGGAATHRYSGRRTQCGWGSLSYTDWIQTKTKLPPQPPTLSLHCQKRQDFFSSIKQPRKSPTSSVSVRHTLRQSWLSTKSSRSSCFMLP